MTLQDIINLTNAGYTKEDIAMLTQADKPAQKEKANAEPPKPEQENKTPVPEDPAITAMKNQIDALKQMMQINNMLTVNQEAPKQRTVDDIFAEIINPPAKDK